MQQLEEKTNKLQITRLDKSTQIGSPQNDRYQYKLWHLLYQKEHLENTVFMIPSKGDRFIIHDIYIYNNYFFVIALDLDNIGIGNGTIEEFQLKGDAILEINPDQSKDLRGTLIQNIFV